MALANEMNKLFGAIAPGMCRLAMNGGIAVKTSSGYKTYNMNTHRLINCDSFALDIGSDFFFCIPTNHVSSGNIILINGRPCCVIGTDGEQIRVINYENNTIDTVLPERHMFMGNMYFYSKIVSPFGNGAIAKNGKGAGAGMKRLFKYAMMSEMLKGSSGGFPGMGKTDGQSGMLGGMPMMFMMMNGGFDDMFNGMFDDDDDGEFMGGMFDDDSDAPPRTSRPKDKTSKGGKTAPKRTAPKAQDKDQTLIDSVPIPDDDDDDELEHFDDEEDN